MEHLYISNILLDSFKEKIFNLIDDVGKIQNEFDYVKIEWESFKNIQKENERLLKELHSEKNKNKKLEKCMSSIRISKIGKCCICEKNNSEYAPSNCGHLCLCKDCKEVLETQLIRTAKCPICRGVFQPCIKIYLNVE